MSLGARSYANSLFIGNIFDNIPDTKPDLRRFADKVLNPTVEIKAPTCGTFIGTKMPVSSDLIGLLALDTDTIIDEAYLQDLYERGVSEVRIRETSTCIVEGGICLDCYLGYLALHGYPPNDAKVGDRVTLPGRSDSYLELLGNTYSGSLLGILPVPAMPTPLSHMVHSSILKDRDIDRACDRLKELGINRDEYDYLCSVKDRLERSLLLTAYYGVYGNATSNR